MAAKFGAFVHGVDLSVNMVTTALERTVASVNGQKVRTTALCMHVIFVHRVADEWPFALSLGKALILQG